MKNGAPATSSVTLVFLAGVLVLIGFDYPNGTWTLAASPLVVLMLVIGWNILRRHSPALMPPTVPSIVLTQNILE